jgi:hypothetical protein
MMLRNILLATAGMALMGGAAAQDRPAYERHLLYIATPGGGGGDGQSGIVVLDADHDYRFVKRISYGAAKSPQITGIAASVPEGKLYVARVGSLLALDLNTDKVVWEFKGEKEPVATTRGGAASNGCCERPYALPGGRALLVASAYNNWWWFIDAHTGGVLGKIDTPDAPNAHNLALSADGKIAALASLTPISAALAPKSSPARLYGKPMSQLPT